MRYKKVTDGAMSFKGILSSPYFWAFEQAHDLLATRSIWLKTQLHCIFLQEWKKLFEPQVDVWASVWFYSSQSNHSSRTPVSLLSGKHPHNDCFVLFSNVLMIPSCRFRWQAVQVPQRQQNWRKKTGCNCNDTSSQVNFNVIVQFAAFYVFLQALGLVIDQYWNSNSSHKTLTKNSDKSRQ